ncbi:MAG: hypothetical protein LBR58_00695 [Propionibacteriaceae bacterium]|jgi:glycine betaine/choline ABC-type transport system substrate-binding protein|nr:hypothetical protein [Propionibacteriaceae bacterium]
MDRRQFLISLGGLAALAGCAQTMPETTPTPTVTPTPKTVLKIWSGSTPVERAVREVLAAAVVAADYEAETKDVVTDGVEALMYELQADPLAMTLGFAGTMLDALPAVDEPPPPDELLATLAAAVEESATLLKTTPLDGKLVWAVLPETGLTSLAELKQWTAPAPKTIGISAAAGAKSDGYPALTVTYGAALETVLIASPTNRAERLRSGELDIAGFRACESAELAGFTILEDTLGLGESDPMVTMVNPALPEAEPAAILAVTDALKKITPENFAALEKAVAGGADAKVQAAAWLASH